MRSPIELPCQHKKALCCQDLFQGKVMFTVSFLPQVRPIVNLWKADYFLEVATRDTISPKIRFTLDT